MTARSEQEAAYYTLLRARDEHDALLRYRDYLERELRRLAAFVDETAALAEPVPAKVRRPVDATTRQLVEAVGRRRGAVEAELRRADDRIAAAAAFVEECEADVAALRA